MNRVESSVIGVRAEEVITGEVGNRTEIVAQYLGLQILR